MAEMDAPVSKTNLRGLELLTLTRNRMMLLSISSGIFNALSPEVNRATGALG
jgi:hypothetical protein